MTGGAGVAASEDARVGGTAGHFIFRFEHRVLSQGRECGGPAAPEGRDVSAAQGPAAMAKRKGGGGPESHWPSGSTSDWRGVETLDRTPPGTNFSAPCFPI